MKYQTQTSKLELSTKGFKRCIDHDEDMPDMTITLSSDWDMWAWAQVCFTSKKKDYLTHLIAMVWCSGLVIETALDTFSTLDFVKAFASQLNSFIGVITSPNGRETLQIYPSFISELFLPADNFKIEPEKLDASYERIPPTDRK